MKYTLTKKQQRAYEFISAYIAENGHAPSFENIKLGLGLKSKNTVYILVHGMRERGWIEFLPYRRRSLTLL